MEDKLLETNENVMGQIYSIENIKNKKKYVGQTLTHRKNKSKYRPFGYIGRFKDHLSEAVCNTKKKQCSYLNNAIRAYGKDSFKVSLLHTCDKNDLDHWEKYYIQQENTLYPNGYNLTKGGKTFVREKAVDILQTPILPSKSRGGSINRSDSTKNRISERLKEYYNKQENVEKRMLLTQTQHNKQKLERFLNEKIDLNNLDQYLRFQNRKSGPVVKVVVNKKEATFVGKHQTLEELTSRAIEFLQCIAESATLSNCSGNP
jgi:group I intron endonuclease